MCTVHTLLEPDATHNTTGSILRSLESYGMYRMSKHLLWINESTYVVVS